MRVVNVSHKLHNKYLAKDVYDNEGRLLLGRNVQLTPSLIDKLIESDVFIVYIEDQLSEGIEVKNVISDEQMIHSVRSVKHIMNNITKQDSGVPTMIREEDLALVGDIIKELIEALEENEGALYTVVELLGADMYTYKHCVNVAVLSILTCKSLSYDYELTKHIAMGALLHDIGKAAVKDNLIQKIEPLTDQEMKEVHNHVIYGYDAIKDDISLSGYTKQIVRLHHEKRDGSGYPLGLKETEIPDFVRIVTICDMFDAMSSTRAYKKSMPVYEVLDILMAESVFKLDPVILQMFTKNICVYPPGSGVKLDDGRFGLVVNYNKFSPTRPEIRVFEDNLGNMNVSHIDLQEERTLFIEKTVATEIIKEHYKL
ncbi:HD-GYP domain-containing protein [Acidaminobacter sp. JC074]|uniref:HD-GYP domain-containing protein n=1 Tax=Acidaminobacter sp. JC074 TaxID=2530199 RepID=UPI001F0D87C3|nr:HD-GYP domain-containing protein [Acidaminobacter sp. JC074]